MADIQISKLPGRKRKAIILCSNGTIRPIAFLSDADADLLTSVLQYNKEALDMKLGQNA